MYCELSKCGLSEDSKFFLERWLDITKSTLLFARGVLFVEGIAEAMVIPELAKSVINDIETNKSGVKNPETLEDYGISVINMNGIYFNHFMQLFSGYSIDEYGFIDKNIHKIDILCAGITDNDPKKNRRPTKINQFKGSNHCLNLIHPLETNSEKCRLFVNLKTFEYDLALENANLNSMLSIISDQLLTEGKLRKELNGYMAINWQNENDEKKKDAAYWLLCRLEKEYPIGKGVFNQILANKLKNKEIKLYVPEYIIDAIKWVIGTPLN
jgi:predicted ATP-dependent endonuclease of OLD family